jgi:hypothetical protein
VLIRTPTSKSHLSVQEQRLDAVIADPIEQGYVEHEIRYRLLADHRRGELPRVSGHDHTLGTAREGHKHRGLSGLGRLVDHNDTEYPLR